MIDQGKYNRRIMIYRMIEEPDAVGQVVQTASSFLNPWAYIHYKPNMQIKTGNEFYDASQKRVELNGIADLRYTTSITAGMWFKYNDEWYDILAAFPKPDEEGIWKEMEIDFRLVST